ncbi:hypothetical protein [Mucilaginibacter sp. UYCu711]|uniref:hypothetical protein n=1 Tax=Mucilaginibacter sp. UYCu711 TaxID=3156339 RepID=UPI003D1F274F
MEIIITWPQIIAVLFVYFFYRYISGCIKKLYCGAESPFDPFVPYADVRSYEAWRKGFNQGQRKLQKKYVKYLDKIKAETLKLSDSLQAVFDKSKAEETPVAEQHE